MGAIIITLTLIITKCPLRPL